MSIRVHDEDAIILYQRFAMLSSFQFMILLSKGSVLVSFGLVVLLTVFKCDSCSAQGSSNSSSVSYRSTFDADEIIPVSTVLIARIFSIPVHQRYHRSCLSLFSRILGAFAF